VLWSISPRLFLIAALYALCGSVLTIWLGRSLVRLNFNQCDLEADFRSNLVHVRQNAESIILSHREARLNSRVQSRLDHLVENSQRIISINRNLGFSTNFYNYLIQIIPALIIAPLFIDRKVEFGVITQSAMAFATLLGAFSLIITQFQSISAFSAVISRLTGLSEAINDCEDKGLSKIVIRHREGVLECHKLTLLAEAGGAVLVDQLDLRMMSRERWWVTTTENAAKLALFRALAGFWEHGEGLVERPGVDDFFLLPERPYLPPGTLREVLLRMRNESTTPDDKLMEILNQLGLGDLPKRVGGLNVDRDWVATLSDTELHMLSVARILLTRPSFAILDRPDSLLAKDQISAIMNLLKTSGIGVMVLSKHDSSPVPCDASLNIHKDGTWTIGRTGEHPVSADA
jgi:putative ATP-binding cassette transporter